MGEIHDNPIIHETNLQHLISRQHCIELIGIKMKFHLVLNIRIDDLNIIQKFVVLYSKSGQFQIFVSSKQNHLYKTFTKRKLNSEKLLSISRLKMFLKIIARCRTLGLICKIGKIRQISRTTNIF